MITVDFQLNVANLEEDIRHSPESADQSALEETYFVMPVRLCVDGVDLLERSSVARRNVLIGTSEQSIHRIQAPNEASCWLPLPVLGFASGASQALERIRQDRGQKLYLAGVGYLVFSRQVSRVSIESSINGKECSTDMTEALSAIRTFSYKVQQMLVTRIPAMQKHPSWGQWFG